jgi:hypothetical protein
MQNAHLENKNSRRAQTQKFKIEHDDQSVIQNEIPACATMRKQVRTKIQMQAMSRSMRP